MTNFPISRPLITLEEIQKVSEVMKSKWISSQGKYIKLFEKRFSKFNQTKYSVSVSNGSVALILALKALGVSKNDEVIIPNITFSATINSIINIGAKPVIVDIRKDNWTIDIKKLEKKITKKTKAIIVVHIYGQPVDINNLLKIKKKYNLKIIEDCAEAHGAEYNRKKVGSFFDIGCFSFYANKIFTTGEGGICCTNKKSLYKKLLLLKCQGLPSAIEKKIDISKRFLCTEYGFNFRMTNIQAAIGYVQLLKARKILKERDYISKVYTNCLSKNKFIIFPKSLPNAKSVNWIFTIIIKKNIKKLMRYLKKNKIETRPIFYPFDKTKIFKKYVDNNESYANSSYFFKNGISLPTYNGIRSKDVAYICKKINQFCYEK